MAVGEGEVWVASLDGDSVTRIDPDTNRVVGEPIKVTDPSEVAVGAGAVWVAGSAVTRIDPDTNRVVGEIASEAVPYGLAVGEGEVWVASLDGDSVTRIYP